MRRRIARAAARQRCSASSGSREYGSNCNEPAYALHDAGPTLAEDAVGHQRIRSLLRSYTAAAIADTWPEEASPIGQYPRFNQAFGHESVEGAELGRMLSDVEMEIEGLAPPDDYRRQVAERLRNRVGRAVEQRWQLIFSACSTMSWPFLLVLTAWLSIIFAVFGLTSPRSRLVNAVVELSALSIASPLYLILYT